MKNTMLQGLAVSAFLMDLALIGVVAYLAFVFPRTVAVWAESDTELATGQMWLAEASAFCSAYGFVLLPALLLATAMTFSALLMFIWKRA